MSAARPWSSKEYAWHEIDGLARAKQGAVSREDSVRAGLPSSTFNRQAATMQWRRPHRGVYVLPGTRATFGQEAAAALLALGERALLTGEAALCVYEIVTGRPALLDLVVPASARLDPRQGVRLRRTRVYDAIRARTIDGLRAVHPTRALADSATWSTDVVAARRIARAIALRHCTLGQARAELEARKRFPGRAAYHRALLMLEGELTHSAGEQDARRHLREAGLHPYPRPYPVIAGGRILAEADIAIVPVRYDIEIDGPHHDLPEQVKADKARDRRLGRHGWTVDRYPVEFVAATPGTFVREVLARVRQLEHR
jgi:hypothetical protein